MKTVASPRARWVGDRASSLTLCSLLAVVGCVGAEPTATSFLARDSSGVRLVENSGPLWADEEAWRVVTVPRVQIGAVTGEAGHVLSEVVGAARLSDGRIVLGDGASRTLRFYSPEGAFLGSTGQVGEGPGEYNEITRIAVTAADSVVVMDRGLQRITILDSSGSFGRSIQLPSSELSGYADFLGVLSDRRALVSVAQLGIGTESGLRRRPHALFAVDLQAGGVEQVGTILGPQEVIEGSRSVAYLFGAHTEVTPTNSGILTLSTDQSSLTVLSLSGMMQLRFSWPADRISVTQELVSVAMEDRVARFPPGVSPRTVERLRSRRLDDTVAPLLPAARSLQADLVGNVWIEPFPTPGQGQPAYMVFRSDGVWLGRVALPEGLKRGTVPAFDPALEIGEDYVLGVWVDDLGIEFVREYRLEKAETGGQPEAF